MSNPKTSASQTAPKRTVMITNMRDRPLVLNLPAVLSPEHAIRMRTARPAPLGTVGRADAKMIRAGQGHAPIPKTRIGAQVLKNVSGSITLAPRGKDGSKKRDLSPSVQKAPDVIAAKARGDIAVEIVKVDAKPLVQKAHDRQLANPRRSATRRAEIKEREKERIAAQNKTIKERITARDEREAKRKAPAPVPAPGDVARPHRKPAPAEKPAGG